MIHEIIEIPPLVPPLQRGVRGDLILKLNSQNRNLTAIFLTKVLGVRSSEAQY